MSTGMDFVRHSLELHLFFARIMKEHSFFLELGFTPRDKNYMEKADEFRREFDRLLGDVVSLWSRNYSGIELWQNIQNLSVDCLILLKMS